MSNFWKRTLFGALFVAAVLISVIWVFYLFTILFLLFSIGAAFEFNSLLGNNNKVIKRINAAAVGGIFLTTALFFFKLIGEIWFLANLIFPIAVLMYDLKQPCVKFDFLKTWAKTIIYPGLGFVAMILLMFNPVNGYHFSQSAFIALLVMVWVNDTFAYLTGRILGKTLIFPTVSPKKTWEGSVGGILLTIIAGIIFASVYPFMNMISWILVAFIVALAAIAGDYLASILKRKAEVEDSGNFLPGHGGILDRFDSLVIAAPAIWICLFLISVF